MKNIDLLKKYLEKLNISYNDTQINKLSAYYDILIDWNSRMNLTAITDEEGVIIKHFVDSLLIKEAVDMDSINSLIDIGTGAGFPAIPIKILYPHIQMTLIDALNKRITFLNHLVDEINLDGVECIHGRAERFGKDDQYREQYDICVSRAVSHLSVLSEYCIPFVKCNGQFVAYKSSESMTEIEESINAIHILGGELNTVKEVSMPFSDIKRCFAVIDKINLTDSKFPRKEGKPCKKPL